MQPTDTRTKQPKTPSSLIVVTLIVCAILAVSVLLIGFNIGGPAPKSYSFVTNDHPINMWEDGKDKWSYFMIETQQSIGDTAKKARAELIPLGFTEDTTKPPWFRFTKDNLEVIVCNHDEFSTNPTKTGTKLILHKSTPKAAPFTAFPCVLVKNGPGTETSMTLFNIKKLVRGW